MEKKLSIIIPVFNEKESISTMVRFLNSSLKFQNEILIVYDDLNDNSIPETNILKNEFANVKTVLNTLGKGVKFAIESGIKEAKFDNILICTVDEIFPILTIEKMLEMMLNENYDFVSGTRYSKGGKRIGGSFIGSLLSRIANKSFVLLTGIPFNDCTTGLKMMRKEVWKSIKLESEPIGWAFAFELSIKVYLKKYKVSEFPFKSVDRLFGGSSTFKSAPWIKEYIKWFIWGLKKIRKNEKKK